MISLFGVHVHSNVTHFCKNTRPRDMPFVLKDILYIKDEKLRHADAFVYPFSRTFRSEVPQPKVMSFAGSSQFRLLVGSPAN